jgi:mRNA-degrading endonuclease RelE of RelBE toxin-antitoxin system
MGRLEDHWRLRVGDWRVVFHYAADGTIEVDRVVNRRDAYD